MFRSAASRRQMLVTVAGFAGALAVGPGASLAADATTPSSTEVNEVVVTVQRRAENIQAVPANVQAITTRQLDALGINDTSDLDRVSTNFEVQEPNGMGNNPIITIRGIGLNDYDSNNAGPNGVYADEIYQSSPASQMLQVYDMERVEVLKGPQGTLYGRNASGGAVNFISKKPTDDFSADMHLELSEYDTVNLSGGVGGPLAQNLDGRISLSIMQGGGYVHNDVTGKAENDNNIWGTRLQLKWKPIAPLTMSFNIHGSIMNQNNGPYQHVSTFVPGTQGGANPVQCPTAAIYAGQCVDLWGLKTPAGYWDGDYVGDRKVKMNSLGASVRADYALGDITLTSLTGIEHNDKVEPDDTDAGPYNMVRNWYYMRATSVSQELRATQTTDRFNWVAGLYYMYEDLHQNQPQEILYDFDQYGGFGIPPGPGNGDDIAYNTQDKSTQLTNAYAAYGQGTYDIFKALKLTLGGRYTYETKSFDYFGSEQLQMGGEGNFGPNMDFPNIGVQESRHANFSYKAVLDYYFTPMVHTYASIATGFKSSDFNGSFLTFTTDPVLLARQLAPVLPEHVTTYEIGLKSTLLDHKLILNIDGFYNDYRDMQVFSLVDVTESNGLPGIAEVLDNAPKVRTDGVEFEATARPIRGLTGTFNVGLLDTKLIQFVETRAPGAPDYSGNRLPSSPKVTFTAVVDYRHPFADGTLDFQFSASYKSLQYFDYTQNPFVSQPAYWLENIRAGYEFDHGKWEIAAFVRNLSNQKYEDDIFDLRSPFGFLQGITGKPRWIGAEVNCHF